MKERYPKPADAESLVGTNQDVTEHRTAELQSRSLIDAMEQFSEVFVLYDADDRLVKCNQRHRDLNQGVIELTEPGVI